MKTLYAALAFATVLAAGSVAQAEGGCGAGWFRGPYGHCHPKGAVIVAPAPVVVAPAAVYYAPIGRPCPRGWHLGPAGRRCWPN